MILVVHNEGSLSNSSAPTGTGAQIIALTTQMPDCHCIDESAIGTEHIRHYNKYGNTVIFVTRALAYVDCFSDVIRVYWSHNYYIPPDIHKLSAKLDKIIGVSGYHQLWLTYKFKRLVYRIYNCYQFPQMNLTSRKYLRCSLAFVGALNRDKGFYEFIDILYDLSSMSPGPIVKVFGDGEGLARLLKAQEDLPNIKFEYFGRVPKREVYKELRQTNLLLYGLNPKGPAESFGLAFLDAQICGAIPLTLNRGAVLEVINPKYHKFSICKSKADIVEKIISCEYLILKDLNQAAADDAFLESRFSFAEFKSNWTRVVFQEKLPTYSIAYTLRYIYREIHRVIS